MSERPSHTQIAVALRWDGQGAPKVTAKGRGDTAEKILQLANEHGITLQHEKELVELLVLVELNHEIPQSMYVAIAEIIAFAYSLSGKSPLV
jgi:flagellar biosynthesis protein